MKSDLDLIIETLLAERTALEKAVKESISETDYMIAHYHHEALIELNNKLRVLQSFKDPIHQKRQELEQRKAAFLKRDETAGLSQEAWDWMSAYWLERIKKEEDKVKELSQSINKYFTDNQLIDDALFNICQGVHKGFTIRIDEHRELILKFENVNGQLNISTKNDIEFYEPDFIIDNRVSTHLSGLGFKFDDDMGEYVYKYDLTDFKDATPIKILLSRIVFDLYKLYEINQNCTLVYYN